MIGSQGGPNKMATANFLWLHFLTNRSSIQSFIFLDQRFKVCKMTLIESEKFARSRPSLPVVSKARQNSKGYFTITAEILARSLANFYCQ